MFVEAQGIVVLTLWVIFGIIKVWAFADCALRRPDAFPAVGRQTKALWLVLTGVSALTALLPGLTLGIFGIAGLVVALIYIFDIRPRILEITSGR